MNAQELLLGLAAGLGLAAACGFRVFVPLWCLSLAAREGAVRVSAELSWIGGDAAFLALGAATLLEIGAYYVPFIDNLLDTVATPAAAIAGALATTALMVDCDPWLRWTLGSIAGAGTATAIQIPTAALRATSSATTVGLANPLVSTGEAAGAGALSGLAILIPLAIPVLLAVMAAAAWYLWSRRKRSRSVVLSHAVEG
jgi:hypothetical protein